MTKYTTWKIDENLAQYRDLNKNGRLDPYEDARLPVKARVEDLLNSTLGTV